MNNTIFDLLEDEIPEGKEGFFAIAKNAPQPKDNSFFDKLSDYSKTALKGFVEGVSRLGASMGPLQNFPTLENGQIKLGKSKEKQLEEQSENLDLLLPTQEDFGQKSIRRGLKEAPTMLAFPGSKLNTLPRSILAGFMGQGAEEIGLPEWAQSAAEITAYIGPDITKKLLSSGKNKEIIDAARRFGMTDEQIAPLLQSEFKQKWLSKISPKRGSTQTALQSTKSQLDQSYGILQKTGEATKEISEISNGKLIDGLINFFKEMPREVQALIEKDLNDLLNNKITGQSLINFYKDINHHLGPETKQLSLLKQPIKEALGSISPELEKDFDMINKLYSKYFNINSKLKPTLVSDLISAGETLGILGSLTMGYYPPLISLIGEKSAKKLAQQMLINPHLQQLSEKMVKAMNENKYGIVKKLTQSFSNQIRKQSPEVSKELDKISEKEIIELLSRHQQQEEK